MLSSEGVARELLDGCISKVYSQQDLDVVRQEGKKTLGGIPVHLESKLASSGLKVLMCDMTDLVLEVYGGSYYMREEKVVVLNARDNFYVAADETSYEIPLALVLYHELGHAHQYIVDGMSGDVATDKIEHDNIVRFEWPMCDVAGLPRRKHYNRHWGATRLGAVQNSRKLESKAVPTTIVSKLPGIF